VGQCREFEKVKVKFSSSGAKKLNCQNPHLIGGASIGDLIYLLKYDAPFNSFKIIMSFDGSIFL